jgi:hypothetical protein
MHAQVNENELRWKKNFILIFWKREIYVSLSFDQLKETSWL